MRVCRVLLLCALLLPALLPSRAIAAAPAWNRVQVGPMKTSIYVGSVTLTLQPLVRHGQELKAGYAAKVFPWAFWNESGSVTLAITADELTRLARGERCAFTGLAHNQRGRPRPISGYADPAGPDHGKLKVRIKADGITLVFNGHYTLTDAAPAQASPAQ